MENEKSKVILVYNEGSLAGKTKNVLAKHFYVFDLLIKRKDFIKRVDNILNKLISENEIKLIIFISGETKIEKDMVLKNEKIPTKVANLCLSNYIPLIYLSSLSVFGIPEKNKIYNFSIKKPFNIYGITKNNFDKFIERNLKELNYCAISPGSIINPISKNGNIIENFKEKLQKNPLKIIFKLISPAGNFACIHIDDLVEVILKESIKLSKLKINQSYKKFICCSKNISIFDVICEVNKSKPLFKIISIPPNLLNFILFFLTESRRMKIIVYLSNLNYYSDYSFISRRLVNDFMKNVN